MARDGGMFVFLIVWMEALIYLRRVKSLHASLIHLEVVEAIDLFLRGTSL